MALKDIVFSKTPLRTIDYLEHKIVVKGLTTKDTLEMNIDLSSFSGGEEGKTNIKNMLNTVIEMLSSIIVSVDGEVPTNRDETKAFLLNQSQQDVMEIFRLSNVFGSDDVKEEIKN